MRPEQTRLGAFGVDVPAEREPATGPVCERCSTGVDPDEALRVEQSMPEVNFDVTDLRRGGGERLLCEDCVDVERYLHGRHQELTAEPGVVSSVAVFCECQDSREVDVCPLRRGDSLDEVACSGCGSQQVVVEELPPDGPDGAIDGGDRQ